MQQKYAAKERERACEREHTAKRVSHTHTHEQNSTAAYLTMTMTMMMMLGPY